MDPVWSLQAHARAGMCSACPSSFYVIINSDWPVIWVHSHLVESYPKQFFSRLLNLRHPLTQYGENVAGGSHFPHALVAARVKEGQFQSTAFRADGSVGNRMWNRYKSLLRLRKGAISQHLFCYGNTYFHDINLQDRSILIIGPLFRNTFSYIYCF